MFTKQDQRLIYSYDAEKLWIEPWGENALRVRATKMPEMPMEDWALLNPDDTKVDISITPYGASIVNGKIKAELNSAGEMAFYNQKENYYLKNM